MFNHPLRVLYPITYIQSYIHMYNYKYYQVTVLTIRSSPIIFPTLSPPYPSPYQPLLISSYRSHCTTEPYLGGTIIYPTWRKGKSSTQFCVLIGGYVNVSFQEGIFRNPFSMGNWRFSESPILMMHPGKIWATDPKRSKVREPSKRNCLVQLLQWFGGCTEVLPSIFGHNWRLNLVYHKFWISLVSTIGRI